MQKCKCCEYIHAHVNPVGARSTAAHAHGLNPLLQVHSGSPSPDLKCLRLQLRASHWCLCIKPLTFST